MYFFARPTDQKINQNKKIYWLCSWIKIHEKKRFFLLQEVDYKKIEKTKITRRIGNYFTIMKPQVNLRY